MHWSAFARKSGGVSWLRVRYGIAAVLAVSLSVAVFGGTAGSAAGAKTTISVAYTTDWELATSVVAPFWTRAAQTFEKANPNVTVKLIGIPGSYNDLVDKLSLLYRSSSTAPTIADVPLAATGLWASSGFLAPLDTFVSSTPWWKAFPAGVKASDRYQGHVYSASAGQNTEGLWYDKAIFAKAGIAVPWHPRTWDDILAAAIKVKKADPGVAPLWALGGTGAGSESPLFGIYNLILGSSTPQVYQSSTSKWVIDSPGIRAALAFYVKLHQQGLQDTPSVLFNPGAISNISQIMKSQQVGIVMGPNWFGPDWTKFLSSPNWPQGPSVYSATQLPNQAGTGFASVSSSWGYTMAAGTANKALAFKFIAMLQQSSFNIPHTIGGAFVPVVPQYAANKQFTSAAAPYNAQFAKMVAYSQAFPNEAGASVWEAGMGMATGAIIQNGTSVAAAVKIMDDYVTQQLGASKVTTIG